MIDQRALDIAVRRHPAVIAWYRNDGSGPFHVWMCSTINVWMCSIIAEYHRVVRGLAR